MHKILTDFWNTDIDAVPLDTMVWFRADETIGRGKMFELAGRRQFYENTYTPREIVAWRYIVEPEANE